MAAKISRQVLESYFACKFKAHLKLSNVRGALSDYLHMTHEEDQRFRGDAEQRLIKAHSDRAITTRVPLTTSLLKAGAPLILDATFEDEHLHLQFDGIMKVEGRIRSRTIPLRSNPLLRYSSGSQTSQAAAGSVCGRAPRATG